MTSIIQRLKTLLAWLLGRPNSCVRSLRLELERARLGFDNAARRVELLTAHLERVRSERRLNCGQIALLQRDLQQAARNAHAAFDLAIQVQDDLSVLEAAEAGETKVSRTEPIPRTELEELLKQVALAEARAEQYRQVTEELHGAVYGVETSALDRLPILQKETPVTTPAPQKVIKVEPFITNG